MILYKNNKTEMKPILIVAKDAIRDMSFYGDMMVDSLNNIIEYKESSDIYDDVIKKFMESLLYNLSWCKEDDKIQFAHKLNELFTMS